MSRTFQWIAGISLVLIALAVVFAMVAPFFLPNAGWAGHPMMRWPGHMFSGGRMGGWMPIAGLAMIAGPLVLFGLIVLGAAGLVRVLNDRPAQPPAAATRPCPHCGQAIQGGWKACPHCGERVE